MAAKVAFGDQARFLTKDDKKKAHDLNKIFLEVKNRGKFTPKQDDPSKIRVESLLRMYGETPQTVALRNAQLNALAKEVLK